MKTPNIKLILTCVVLLFGIWGKPSLASNYETLVVDWAPRPGWVELKESDLKNYRSSTLAEVINSQVASVSLNSSQKGLQSLLIRGSKSEHILVLIDGVPVNDGSSPGGAFDFGQIPASIIESIRISLKPSTVEYGAAALAATVDVRLKPNSSIWGASIGNQGQGSLWGQAKDITLNLDVDDRSSVASGAEPDHLSRIWVSYSDSWRLNSTNRIKFLSFFNQRTADLDDTFPAQADDMNARSQANSGSIMAVWTHDIGSHDKFELTAARYQIERDERDYDLFGQPEPVLESKFFQHQLKTQWSRQGLGPTFFIGAELKKQSFAIDTDYSGSITSESGDQDESSVFFKQFLQTIPGLSFGLRYDRSFTKPFWQKSVDYQIELGGWQLQTGYSESEKSPSLYQRYSTYGNQDLNPEKSYYSYLGFNRTWESMIFSAEFFQTRASDFVSYDSATSKYQNIERVQIQGIEFKSAWNLSTGQSLHLDLVYLEPIDLQKSVDLPSRPRQVQVFRWNYQPSELGGSWTIRRQSSRSLLDGSTTPESWSSVVQIFRTDLQAKRTIGLQTSLADRAQWVLSFESAY